MVDILCAQKQRSLGKRGKFMCSSGPSRSDLLARSIGFDVYHTKWEQRRISLSYEF